jgi:hypothetical protein
LAADALGPVESVRIGRNREFRVNGKPFFPLMLWAQSLERLDHKLSIGINTFAGGRGGKAGEYLDTLAARGVYGILHFSAEAVDHPYLLGWIQLDEPDLNKGERNVEITLAPGTRSEALGPLTQLMNGDKLRGPEFNPLEGAGFSMKAKEPVTACRFEIWLTSDPRMSVAKEVVLEGDGRELLRATLENRLGVQALALAKPETFATLTLRVLSVYPGQGRSGRINEFHVIDEKGADAFARFRSRGPRMTAQEVAACYRQVKEKDQMRPVLMTFTSRFMKKTTMYDEAEKQQIYPEYVKYCDVVGFDTYPIFGYNRPDLLHEVADGVEELVAIAGPRRPVYAWIETNAGSRWIDPDKQKPVTPAETRAEVWMAIIRGATAIGYFTHSWWPEYDEFAPSPEMMAELARLDAQISRLAPFILARPADARISMEMNEGLACHLKATEYRRSLYVFAQNMDMERRRGRAVFRVAGLQARTPVEVVDEGRSVTARADGFSDDFGPLAEHVYRIPMPAE